MTYKEACRILGITPNEDKKTVKKKYHELMFKAHPDTLYSKKSSDFIYTAQQINEAYDYLIKQGNFKEDSLSFYDGQDFSKNMGKWDTPQNYYAFEAREVYQFVQDSLGNIIGGKSVAKGKYTWDPVREDFGLFMLSIHKCSERIIFAMDKKRTGIIDQSIRRQYLAELSYLLSQQFIEQSALGRLIKAVKTDGQGRQLFSVPSMLQLESPEFCRFMQKPGSYMSLSRVKMHKIYVRDYKDRELGYITFADDRMYYLIIPLLENNRVSVRFEVASKKLSELQVLMSDYYNLNMWIRVEKAEMTDIWEKINLNIDKLLEAYLEV